jgi:RNA 2',3'-cyclic 3'-phosphodiesterase
LGTRTGSAALGAGQRRNEVPALIRLFVAAELDDAARQACARVAAALREGGFAARWVAPERYHLTVAFLGMVDESRLDDIAATVRSAAAAAAPFELPLDAVGAFPNPKHVRIAWVGSRDPQPAFAALCRDVRGALHPLGFTFEDEAVPHVTLGRADGSQRLPAIDVPPGVTLRTASLALFRSTGEPGGSRYVVLDRFPLASRET